jgi:hypothetical protein
VLYDAQIRLGYDGDAPVYHSWLTTAHGMDQCEVSMMIPFNPTEPWSRSVIGSEPDTGVELMAHMVLSQINKSRRIKGFGENVNHLSLGVYVSHLNISLLYMISEEVVSSLSMSHLFVKGWIFGY